jgi:hypothetical protein
MTVSYPPFNSASLAPALPALQQYINAVLQAANAQPRFGLNTPRCRLVEHSVPKRKHLRRMLSIPNPRAYAVLCDQIALNWPNLHQLCATSPLSMSIPSASTHRAVQGAYGQSAVANQRAQRSIGQRFLLKTDLVRFYPSIYTHSIPWAIHGKEADSEITDDDEVITISSIIIHRDAPRNQFIKPNSPDLPTSCDSGDAWRTHNAALVADLIPYECWCARIDASISPYGPISSPELRPSGCASRAR